MFCVFVGCLPGITQPGYFMGPAALLKRGRGDVPRLAVPPAHDCGCKTWAEISNYSRLAFNPRLWKWLDRDTSHLWKW